MNILKFIISAIQFLIIANLFNFSLALLGLPDGLIVIFLKYLGIGISALFWGYYNIISNKILEIVFNKKITRKIEYKKISPVNKESKNRALKMMLWFGIGSLFMTFAGLTSAFLVSKNREDWVQNFDLPEAFYYSLIFILSSSIILIFARRFLIKNQQKKVSVLLLITILLGTLFIVFQFLGFGQIMADGYHFTGPTSTINSSFIFLIAFVHLVHVLVALLALIVVFVKNLKGVYNHENYTGFDLASIFWHFVDILWIYLFIFLVFFG